MKFRDQRVLQHIELRLEDGTRRPGSDLTIEEIVELRDRGLNPTWMIDTTWLKSAYGHRDETDVNNSDVPEIAHAPGLPKHPEQRVAVLTTENEALRQANFDLRNQAGRLEKELDRRAEERREENELQKQNNILMQQIYTLLSRTQGSVLPPTPRSSQDLTGQLATVDANTSVEQRGLSPRVQLLGE